MTTDGPVDLNVNGRWEIREILGEWIEGDLVFPREFVDSVRHRLTDAEAHAMLVATYERVGERRRRADMRHLNVPEWALGELRRWEAERR